MLKKRMSRRMKSKMRKRKKEETREEMKLRQQQLGKLKMWPADLLWRWRQTWKEILMYRPPERK